MSDVVVRGNGFYQVGNKGTVDNTNAERGKPQKTNLVIMYNKIFVR